MSRLNIPEPEQKIIGDFKKILSEQLQDEIIFIRLFGSRARGDARKESDMDILVVLKRPTEKRINFIYDTAMFLSHQYNIYLSVKIFSQKELEHYQAVSTLFIRNLFKEGIRI